MNRQLRSVVAVMLVITLLWTGLPNFAESSVRANGALTLGDLPVGSLVKEMEGYDGNWVILSQGHYGAGNTLLLLDGTAALMEEAYGTWQNSPVRSFLRSTFYDQLSQRFRDHIAEVTTYQNDEATDNETLFLLSLFELYPTDVDYPSKDILPAGGNHGTLIEGALDYFSNCVDNNKCWLRSNSANNQGRKFLVSVYLSPVNIDYRVKPAVNLIDTTPVFGPYTSEGKTYYTLFEPQIDAQLEAVKAAINSLPDSSQVTLSNKAAIVDARIAYNALSTEQQALVDNLARLTDAEEAITALEDAAASVKATIGNLPEGSQVTLAHKADITAARSAYNALSTEQQALVDNLARLTDAEQAITALEDAAASVKAAIGELPAASQVTLAHKSTIAAARNAYNALSAEQQALVDNLTRLTDAEQVITALEDTAASVKAAIGELPAASQVTLAHKSTIAAARSAYNALSTEQQALVDNLTRLTDAEQAVRLLEFTPSALPIMSPKISDFDLWLNGEKLKLAYWSNPNGQNQPSAKSMVLFKEQELYAYLGNAENGTLLQLPILTGRDQAIVGVSLPLTSYLSKKEISLAINTESYTYTIPMQHLTLDKLLKAFGPSVKEEDILLEFIIDAADEKRIAKLQTEAAAGRLTAVAKPVKFSIVAVSGEVKVEMQDFLGYVERSILLPEGDPASKIVTGVVIEADGSLRHVPTKITQSNGIYRAVISSMTTSVYAIVSFHSELSDIERHWARPYVLEMAARSVVRGDENGRFLPDNVVTRAEFAAMLTRALGLPAENGENPFSDVDTASWYSPSVHSAYKYGLISGFGDGNFHPGSTLTRQQAAVMMASALKLAGAAPASNPQAVESSRPFKDSDQISPWAKDGIDSAAQAGIISGRANGQFDPHLEITRAETATMLYRLLTYLELI